MVVVCMTRLLILKKHRAIQCTLLNDYRADFWEILRMYCPMLNVIAYMMRVKFSNVSLLNAQY